MQPHEFQNYLPYYGRSNELRRELSNLLEHAEKHPQTANQLLTLFNLDATSVLAALTAAANRSYMSGPGGGPRVPLTDFSLSGSGTVADEANYTITIAPTPAGATYDAAEVKWSSSDGSFEYVSNTKTQLVLKAKTAGAKVVTVTIGGLSQTHNVTVT